MSTIYETVKNAKDLVRMAKIKGFNTAEEDIVRTQDIFGHSTIEQLVELASDPDYGGTFYMILFKIWNYEDAIRFYNQHTNTAYIQLQERADKVYKTYTEQTQQNTALRTQLETVKHNAIILNEELAKTRKENEEKNEQLKTAELEIIKLKAMLFDAGITKK